MWCALPSFCHQLHRRHTHTHTPCPRHRAWHLPLDRIHRPPHHPHSHSRSHSHSHLHPPPPPHPHPRHSPPHPHVHTHLHLHLHGPGHPAHILSQCSPFLSCHHHQRYRLLAFVRVHVAVLRSVVERLLGRTSADAAVALDHELE